MGRLLDTYARALALRDFRQLVMGHGVATLAQLQLTMAVALEALNRSGSGLAISVAVALGFAPYILFSGLAGVLADRVRRSTVLRASIAIRFATGLVATAGLYAQWPIAVL